MWGSIVGGLVGGLAGAQGNQTSQTTSKQLAPASQLETQSTNSLSDLLSQLMSMNAAGPGTQDVQQGYQAQTDFAKMLQGLSQTGLQVGQQDFTAAQQQLAPQYQQAQQSMRDSQRNYAQQAGMTGRSATDFAFNTRLGQQNNDLMQQLASQQSSLAYQNAGQRLNYAQQGAQLKSSLAQQAFSNRAAIMGLGQQTQSAERNFRMGTAAQTTSQSSGGGLGGFISGALGGAGAMGSGLENMFSKFSFGNTQPTTIGNATGNTKLGQFGTSGM